MFHEASSDGLWCIRATILPRREAVVRRVTSVGTLLALLDPGHYILLLSQPYVNCLYMCHVLARCVPTIRCHKQLRPDVCPRAEH